MDLDWKKFIPQKCCFCIDLEIGAFIIGYLELIISVTWLAWPLYAIYWGDAMMLVSFFALLAVIILSTVSITASMYLLDGLRKRKRDYILYYLCISVFNFVYVVYVICLIFDFQEWIMVSGIIATMVYRLYFFTIIVCYYVTMNSPDIAPLNTVS
ncbi:uncharacterized protein LOC142977046 isoform X3 [Anticarsia gemmatalis]|uniref:uncharacterized protein LOC142977046 isoform X3 n=1 Tax=Anticarsia gemmatalis TaxID=129554 RepID=UPI003F75A81F